MDKFKAFWASSAGLMVAGCLCGLLGLVIGVWATTDVSIQIRAVPRPRCCPDSAPVVPTPAPRPCPCKPKGPGDTFEAGPCECKPACKCPDCQCPPVSFTIENGQVTEVKCGCEKCPNCPPNSCPKSCHKCKGCHGCC